MDLISEYGLERERERERERVMQSYFSIGELKLGKNEKHAAESSKTLW